LSKIPLKNVTFTIPIKIDSKDREANLTILMDYLTKYFDTNVLVCETNQELLKAFWKPAWPGFPLYLKTNKALFHKTRLLNHMARVATTEIIVSYDCDILLPPQAYVEAANKIHEGMLDFCYPFNKPIKFIKKPALALLREKLDGDTLDSISTPQPNPDLPPGGCFFMNRKKFIEGGEGKRKHDFLGSGRRGTLSSI